MQAREQADYMEKNKLKEARKRKGYSQKDVARGLPTDVSNYSRKENGAVKITHAEWERIAAFLEVAVGEIYEPEESSVAVLGTHNATGNGFRYSVPEFFLDIQRKYMQRLEEENCALRAEIASLKTPDSP